MNATSEIRYINRELSWLAFNHRVLQEAERDDNPVERVRFLAFSRTTWTSFSACGWRTCSALLVDEKSTTTLGFSVRETLSQVGQRVLELQSQYNDTYGTVLDAMREAKSVS